jgi:predicted Zn-dependent protease
MDYRKKERWILVMIDREHALRLLRKIVQESTADQTEAILLTEDSSLTRFAGSAVHQHVAERNQTMVLRVVLGKKIAVVTTNIFQPSSVRQSLQRAILLPRFNNQTMNSSLCQGRIHS